jgi:hypothetical protein
MREDLKVWLSFLSDYNGITVMLDNVWTSILMRQFVCLRIAPMGEIKGSAFIFRVNGLMVVGQKDGRTMGSLLILRFYILSTLKIIRLFFKCIPQMGNVHRNDNWK